MLDTRFIRDNRDAVKEAVRAKGVDLDVDELLRLDDARRRLQHELDEGQARKRALAQQLKAADLSQRAELRRQNTDLDEELKQLAQALDETNVRFTELLLMTPNIPWSGAPVGLDESANRTMYVRGQKPEFGFRPLSHVELAEKRGWAEFARARKVAGERAYALIGDMVLLERALHSFALDVLVAKGFTAISVPALVMKEAPVVGSTLFTTIRDETYDIPADDLFLAGTAEVLLAGLHSDEVLDIACLPILYAGISPCFRREIGSAGRDDPGLVQVHQFEKVEQFVICEADIGESARWHAELLATAEQILQHLGLHYQVVECATGHMGIGKFRMNDINTWFPSLDTFRETHSCSTMHDWQARRANMRYRDADGTVRVAHTVNNTAVATPRLLAAVMENFQTADHRIRVPEALRAYLGNREYL